MLVILLCSGPCWLAQWCITLVPFFIGQVFMDYQVLLMDFGDRIDPFSVLFAFLKNLVFCFIYISVSYIIIYSQATLFVQADIKQ